MVIFEAWNTAFYAPSGRESSGENLSSVRNTFGSRDGRASVGMDSWDTMRIWPHSPLGKVSLAEPAAIPAATQTNKTTVATDFILSDIAETG